MRCSTRCWQTIRTAEWPAKSARPPGLVMVFGEITTSTYVEIPELVRNVIRDIGYTDSSHGFDAETCGVMVSLKAAEPRNCRRRWRRAGSTRKGERRRQVRPDRRRRPGHDDRVRLQRNARADAAADCTLASNRPRAWPVRASLTHFHGCCRTARVRSRSNTKGEARPGRHDRCFDPASTISCATKRSKKACSTMVIGKSVPR